MSSTLSPVDEPGRVLSNDDLGCRLHLMRVESPLISRSIEPGQFVHMRLPDMEAHILRRPFSVYDRDPDSDSMEILYQTVGFGTDRMAGLEPGSRVSCIGPVGRGWSIPQNARRALLVCGGVGAAPLLMQARALRASGVHVDAVLGAQTAAGLVALERYERAIGHEPVVSTDDGTAGYAGFCTVPAAGLIESGTYDCIACCGPEPLMRAVAAMARDADVFCEVSMERRMACGVGACLSCVVDTVDGRKRCCVDGPVFDARKVVW